MKKGDYRDFAAFIAVAEAGSFTKAAAGLGLSQSAVSYSVRMLEKRVGVQLITRTTRSLSLTDAGEQLLGSIRPAFDQIDGEIEAISSARGAPSGNIRVTTSRHAARTILWPVLVDLLRDFPNISVEVDAFEGLVDIVANRFDAGIRLGDQVQPGMVAVPIGPMLRMAVVGTPEYFARHGFPQTPHDLHHHKGVSYRQTTGGGVNAWEFERHGEELEIRMNGQLLINDGDMLEIAALEGLSLAYTLDCLVEDHIASGRLVRVLEDWCPAFPGYHLYYPSTLQRRPAFSLLVDRLRYQNSKPDA